MTTRNLIWLTMVVVAGIVGGFTLGLPFGLIPAVGVLAVSEIVERRARRTRMTVSA